MAIESPQRVLITAAGAGIGKAIASAFAETGARVALCDVDPDAVARCRATLPGVVAEVVDVTDAEALTVWVDDSLALLGGVDVLVNNAGAKGPTAFVEDVSLDEWRNCLAVGLDAQFVCARRVIPAMKAQRRGSIINIASTAGLFGLGMRTPYAAAKWAVVGFTKSLAIELGPYGVRCNALCPGSVAGDRIEEVIGADAAARQVTPDVVAAEYLAGQSISRFVQPEEVAALCLFLCSPGATMITGQAIAIDGHTETFHI